jgi:hypothetical protein
VLENDSSFRRDKEDILNCEIANCEFETVNLEIRISKFAFRIFESIAVARLVAYAKEVDRLRRVHQTN